MPKPDKGGGGKGGGNSGGTTYQGTSGDDVFMLTATELSDATVLGGAGFDTLALSASGDFVFNHRSFKEVSGVDAFNFAQHSGGRLEVHLRRSMFTQSDAGVLTVLSGLSGIDLLAAPSVSTGETIVGGSGDVYLSDTVDNDLTVADGSAVRVHGGAGDDRIDGGGGGVYLDGGAGNDVLLAGDTAGADTVVFAAGYGSDRVERFDAGEDIVSLRGSRTRAKMMM